MDDVGFQTTITIVLVVAMVLLILIEILYLRSRRIKKKLQKGTPLEAKQTKDRLRDEAHNALITGRAIVRTLERSGTPMKSAWELLKEAETAFDRKNFRVCINLVDKAKEMMKSARLAREKKGDLTKLESTPVTPAGKDEMLTKEYIQKKVPENYMQAKFSLGVARKQLKDRKGEGLDTDTAGLVLQDAERAFEDNDYMTALKLAIHCKNMTDVGGSGLATITAAEDEEVIEITEEQLKNRCTGCGEFLTEGDGFCRKCGAKIPKASECEKCGKVAEMDDKFCRGCGSELPG
jgi:RNA polymerase subunit RPABC4/transcription elongation factor Spt4